MMSQNIGNVFSRLILQMIRNIKIYFEGFDYKRFKQNDGTRCPLVGQYGKREWQVHGELLEDVVWEKKRDRKPYELFQLDPL